MYISGNNILERDGQILTEKVRLGHVVHGGGVVPHAAGDVPDGLGQLIGQILRHGAADAQQALHAEGVHRLLLAGVGSGGDLSGEIDWIFLQNGLQLLRGVEQKPAGHLLRQGHKAGHGHAGEGVDRVQFPFAQHLRAVPQAAVDKGDALFLQGEGGRRRPGGQLCGGALGTGADAGSGEIMDPPPIPKSGRSCPNRWRR